MVMIDGWLGYKDSKVVGFWGGRKITDVELATKRAEANKKARAVMKASSSTPEREGPQEKIGKKEDQMLLPFMEG